MAIMGVCVGLLALGLALGVRWRDVPFEPPPRVEAPSAYEVVRRYTWYASIVLTGGVAAGVLVIGAGGRLAMRLLAVTAGDTAQGRITEADQVVGRVTVGGTAGFIVFSGVLGGLVFGSAYLVVRRWLPARWVGGVVFGAALLVVVGTRLDPLREENPDFDLVGPGWLAVLVFALLALLFGLVLSACLARLSTWLPLPARDRHVVVRYLPAAVIAGVGFSITALLVIVGAVVAFVSRWRYLGTAWRGDRAAWVGRVVLVAVVAAALPSAVLSVIHIVDGAA